MRRIGRFGAATLSLGAIVGALSLTAREARSEKADAGEGVEGAAQEVFLGSVALPQDELELQFSAGSSWRKSEEGDVFGPMLLAEFGLTDRVTVEVEAPFVVSVPGEGDAGAGIGNAELGGMYNLVSSPALGLVVSAAVGALVPTASSALIDRAAGGNGTMSAYKLMGPVHTSLSVEGGVEVATGGEERDARFVSEGALSLLVPIGPIIPIAEVGFEREEETDLNLAAGLAWHASEAVEVGLAGLMSGGDEEIEWGAVVNLTWERNLGDERE